MTRLMTLGFADSVSLMGPDASDAAANTISESIESYDIDFIDSSKIIEQANNLLFADLSVIQR